MALNTSLLKRITRWNKRLIGSDFFYYPSMLKAEGLREGQEVRIKEYHKGNAVTVEAYAQHYVVLLSDLTYNRINDV